MQDLPTFFTVTSYLNSLIWINLKLVPLPNTLEPLLSENKLLFGCFYILVTIWKLFLVATVKKDV